MVSSRLTFGRATSPVAVVVALIFFSLSSCTTSVSPVANADDSKPAVDETDPDFVVPDGTPEEIQEFVDKLRTRRPKFANRQEAISHAIKVQRALISAGDKILKQEADEKMLTTAARMKLGALTVLAANQIGDSPKEAMDAVKVLKDDPRPAVAKIASSFYLPIRVVNVGSLNDEERTELINEVYASVVESKFSGESMGNVNQLGEALAAGKHVDQAGELYDRLAKAARESDDSRLNKNAERFEGIGRRMRLPGNFMSLEGKLLKGGELDWSAYRGKVVLVDFWATWCGPCIGELPNVKANYKKYHEKGFEVVGISLDHARDKLEKFIESEEIPWEQMYDEEIQKGAGWSHPMVRHYGINGIPAAILVDKDGKVISMGARGEELPKLLEKLLGPAD